MKQTFAEKMDRGYEKAAPVFFVLEWTGRKRYSIDILQIIECMGREMKTLREVETMFHVGTKPTDDVELKRGIDG